MGAQAEEQRTEHRVQQGSRDDRGRTQEGTKGLEEKPRIVDPW